jgi:hypothetical protein
MCLHSYTAPIYHHVCGFIMSVYFWKLNCHSYIAPCKNITWVSHVQNTLPSIHLYVGLHAVNIRLKIQAQLRYWVCDAVLQIGQHCIPSICFYSVTLIAHIFASHGKAGEPVCKESFTLVVPDSVKVHQIWGCLRSATQKFLKWECSAEIGFSTD